MPERRIHPATTAEELRVELEQTLKFILRRIRGTDEKAARARAVAVIDFLKRHLDDLGVEPALTRSLDTLYFAFAEAERGRRVPLFARKEISHRPPTELTRLYVMTRSALAIDLLMARKITKENAARQVAKKLHEYGFPIEGKIDVPDWKIVSQWRDTLKKAKGHPDIIWYGSIYLLELGSLLGLVREDGVDPRNLAARQLDMVRQSLETSV